MKRLILIILIAFPILASAQTKTCWDIVDSLKTEIQILKAQLTKYEGKAKISDTIYGVMNKTNSNPSITPGTSVKKSPAGNSSSTSHQCHATTKKGYRCSRMVTNGYNCWQHGG